MRKYQDALFKERQELGERECEARWKLIEPHLPARGIVLDIGSNLGFFGLRSVLARDEVAVVSLEVDEDIVELQREIVASHGNTRICIINGAFGRAISGAWVQTCDWVDLTLMLSVLHWMDDPAQVLQDLSPMSAKLIAEIPDPADAGACGQSKILEWPDPVAWFREVTGRRVTLLGRMKRHTSEHDSHLILVDGPVTRSSTQAYWGSRYEHPDGCDYRLEYDGAHFQLLIRGEPADYVPGVNLLSLMKLGRLVWPEENYWREGGAEAIQDWPQHQDPLPHNMVWTPDGLKLIDGDDHKGFADSVEAARTLNHYLKTWVENKTADHDAYVPHVPWFLRRLRSWPRYLAGKWLPSRIRVWIKRRILNEEV